MKSNLKDITVTLVHETDKAYLVDDGTVKAWVPKSLCELELNGDGKSYTLTLPESLLVDKGFLGDD